MCRPPADSLQAALTQIMYLQEHMVPLLVASDTHELKLVHETKNMLLNAEMKLRASLFRTESRGTHYREEYPARDDDNWLAWVLIQRGKDGAMALSNEEVPEKWRPGLESAVLSGCSLLRLPHAYATARTMSEKKSDIVGSPPRTARPFSKPRMPKVAEAISPESSPSGVTSTDPIAPTSRPVNHAAIRGR